MEYFKGQQIVVVNPDKDCKIPKGTVGVVTKNCNGEEGGAIASFEAMGVKNYRLFGREIMPVELENE